MAKSFTNLTFDLNISELKRRGKKLKSLQKKLNKDWTMPIFTYLAKKYKADNYFGELIWAEMIKNKTFVRLSGLKTNPEEDLQAILGLHSSGEELMAFKEYITNMITVRIGMYRNSPSLEVGFGSLAERKALFKQNFATIDSPGGMVPWLKWVMLSTDPVAAMYLHFDWVDDSKKANKLKGYSRSGKAIMVTPNLDLEDADEVSDFIDNYDQTTSSYYFDAAQYDLPDPTFLVDAFQSGTLGEKVRLRIFNDFKAEVKNYEYV